MKHIYICTSPIEGDGVSAEEDIKKGETIQEIHGEARFLTVRNKKESLSYPNWIGVGKDKWINPSYPNQYLNHSCNPNAGIKGAITISQDKSVKGKYVIVALKPIKEGEEITIDYSIIEGDDLWEMKCKCGEKNCRKIIRSIQHLPERQFKKYLPNVPAYFKNLYLKEHSLAKLAKA
ncbi:MAG: SET domain-containing protein [Nanoarchaeota archaeon]|nr:SET domain-containing protein [Nanoarchaeota archaeon]